MENFVQNQALGALKISDTKYPKALASIGPHDLKRKKIGAISGLIYDGFWKSWNINTNK